MADTPQTATTTEIPTTDRTTDPAETDFETNDTSFVHDLQRKTLTEFMYGFCDLWDLRQRYTDTCTRDFKDLVCHTACTFMHHSDYAHLSDYHDDLTALHHHLDFSDYEVAGD